MHRHGRVRHYWRSVVVLGLLPWVMAAGSPVFAQDADASALIASIDSAEKKARELADRLAACAAKGQDIAHPDAALATAELFCKFSRHDATQPALRGHAVQSMKYVNEMLDAELRRAEDVLASKMSYPEIPQWKSVLGVRPRDGGFYVGDEPVFLTSFNWSIDDTSALRRLGANMVDGGFSAPMREDGTFDDAPAQRERKRLRTLADAGFVADYLMPMPIPKWMVKQQPELNQPFYSHYQQTVFDHPGAVAYQYKHIDHYVPQLAQERSMFSIDLANEPQMQGVAPVTMENWRAWLKEKYGSIEALNAAWGVKLSSFDEITRHPTMVEPRKSYTERAKVDFSQPGMRGAHYDWCVFNDHRLTQYFRQLSDRVHAAAPHVATHVKVTMNTVFMGSHLPPWWGGGQTDLSFQTYGIDPEAIVQFTDIAGCDYGIGDSSRSKKVDPRNGNALYAIGWITNGLTGDLYTSVAPDKPFYNSEWHSIGDVDEVDVQPTGRGHMVTALWLSHLHGMDANMAWFWGRTADGSPVKRGGGIFKHFHGSLLQQPWTLQGYAQETLSIRRFVRPIMAFSEQPRRVQLLYSKASAIQDVAYIDTLRDTYEALNFSGVHIGLLTERQLATAGVPSDTQLVVVPYARFVPDESMAALREAAARGVTIGVIGEGSLAFVPTGGRRNDNMIPGARVAALDKAQDYQPHLETWIESAGVERDLLAVDAEGRPAWGVEVRTAQHGNQRLAYLINLMQDPVTVTLRWSSPGAGAQFQDWRTDQPVPNEVTLQPRQVVFGAY